jgi:hypothetical protein
LTAARTVHTICPSQPRREGSRFVLGLGRHGLRRVSRSRRVWSALLATAVSITVFTACGTEIDSPDTSVSVTSETPSTDPSQNWSDPAASATVANSPAAPGQTQPQSCPSGGGDEVSVPCPKVANSPSPSPGVSGPLAPSATIPPSEGTPEASPDPSPSSDSSPDPS